MNRGSDQVFFKRANFSVDLVGTGSRVSRVREFMSSGFAVEVDRKVVGVAVRVAGGFKFFSSHPDFSWLEAKVFRKARTIGGHLAGLARARHRKRGEGSRPRAFR